MSLEGSVPPLEGKAGEKIRESEIAGLCLLLLPQGVGGGGGTGGRAGMAGGGGGTGIAEDAVAKHNRTGITHV